VGHGPCAIAELDGSIWVTNYGDGTLSRIDPLTNIPDDPIQIGSNPCGLTALEGSLWVGVLATNEVVRFDPTTQAVAQHVNVDGDPWDVQNGFGSIWVAVQGTDKVLRIDPASGEVVASFDAGSIVVGLAVTSSEVWVANSLSGTITRIDPDTNTIAGEILLPADPSWFAVGLRTVLVTLSNNGKAALIDQATAQVITTTTVGLTPRDPGFVGENYWVANAGSEDVYVLDANDGSVKGMFTPPDKSGIFVAEGLLGDGWIESFSGTAVARLDAGTGLP
jgi:DNA-binding beta-propeller fold protein YncE